MHQIAIIEASTGFALLAIVILLGIIITFKVRDKDES